MQNTDEPLPLISNGNGSDQQRSPGDHQQEQVRGTSPNIQAYLNRGSELWTHWTWLGGQGKMSLMRCNYCLVNKQLKNAPKCRRHLIKCQKTPELIRKYFERKEIEASRVSAFMREVRSKEVKFQRNDKNLNPIVPLPTANDLKHLKQKQNHLTSVICHGGNNNNSTIVKQNGTSSLNGIGVGLSSLKSSQKHLATTLVNNNNQPNTEILNNKKISSPLSAFSQNNLLKNDKTSNKLIEHQQQQMHNNNHNKKQKNEDDTLMGSSLNDINYNLLYQLMHQSITPLNHTLSDSFNDSSSSSPPPMATNQSTIINSSNSILASKLLKSRKSHDGIVPGVILSGQSQTNGNNNNNNNGSSPMIINGNHSYHHKKLHHHHNHNNHNNTNNNNNNTVVINLDDSSMENIVFFDQQKLEGNNKSNMIRHENTYLMNGLPPKKKRPRIFIDSTNHIPHLINGNNNGSNGDSSLMHHAYHHESSSDHDFSHSPTANESFLNSRNLEIVHDELNDLLMSALISSGVDLDFVQNQYFQKFIAQLVDLSSTIDPHNQKSYRLPPIDKLSSTNIQNLIRKFDYEAAKLFSGCDSIVVSFGNNFTTINDSSLVNGHNFKRLHHTSKHERRFDVNLLVANSNTCTEIFLKTITCGESKQIQTVNNGNSENEINIKSLNNQIDSLFNKIGPDRINAIILPYKDVKISELIQSYLSACHNHIVPLTNSYQLFHHLLCDICRIPSIYKILNQSIALLQELETNLMFDLFHEDNQNHWKQVFESDKLKIFKYFLNQCGQPNSGKNTYWISLNLMLCWFLVARSSIMKMFESLSRDTETNDEVDDGEEKTTTTTDNVQVFSKINFDLGGETLDEFFDQISVLFNFLTPFINAIHLIENESAVISDIVKIYYDVKLAINNNNFFSGINKICDKIERQAIDSILNEYLQEHNLSRYFFLAYYLDPRFRDDKRIEENEELTAQVYDALFCYANALECVSNENEDREKLVDSLESFRNGDKLYGMQLLKCPKSPSKFWKHLCRFPGSAKLAHCAQRLLSISTRSMLMAAPAEDKCFYSLYDRILNQNNHSDSELMMDLNWTEKILPIKSFLLSNSHKISDLGQFDNDLHIHQDLIDKNNGNDGDDTGSGKDSSSLSWIGSNISNIISNVISSLDQYSSTFIAQPFSSNDLSTLIQPLN